MVKEKLKILMILSNYEEAMIRVNNNIGCNIVTIEAYRYVNDLLKNATSLVGWQESV